MQDILGHHDMIIDLKIFFVKYYIVSLWFFVLICLIFYIENMISCI